jgi:diguanylate cyclase (GGDEF)-like protein
VDRERIAFLPIGSLLLVPAALVAGAAGAGDRRTAGAAAAAALTLTAAWVAARTIRRLRSAQSLALRDPLTGLPNRALLEDRVEQALRRSRRTGEPFAAVILDLDGFKEINDIRGHRAGDEVLVQLARRLEEAVRESDTVARIGGDEFAVLSLGTRDEDEAVALVARLRQALRTPIELGSVEVEIDASIGLALFPDDGDTPDALLGRADGEMYQIKRDLSDEPRRRGSLDAGIVREFEAAMERNELVVHYQPILRLSDGRPVGLEALVRRFHPERGVVSPAEFIPHVERTSLIRDVTLFVTAEALETLQTLREQGHELGVSVNVPYRAVDDAALSTGLKTLLVAAGLPASVLTLEIAPTGPGIGGELDREVVTSLRSLGLRISVDDFGRASSLTAVRALPLDQVKIDASFVHGLARNAGDAAVVGSLVRLGHELGLEVVAEGVESRAVWEAAAAHGCDLAQGFYAAAPMAGADLAAWLDVGRAAASQLAS